MTNSTCAHGHGRDTLLPGAENTTKQAGNLPDSEVFSRPESIGFGLDGRIGNDRRSTCFEFSHPVHPMHLKSATDGFQVQQGTETMSNHVTTKGIDSNDTLSHTKFARVIADRPKSRQVDPLSRQQAIENHLSAALHHVRHADSAEGYSLAVGRAVRAASLLKQACTKIIDPDEPTPAEVKAEIDRALELGFKVEAIKHLDWHIGTKKYMRVEWSRVKTLPKLKALNDAAQAAKTGGAA